MKNDLRIVPAFILVLVMSITSSCSNNKSGRPWGISDEAISVVVKSELKCDGIDIVVDKVEAPQTVCDQLGSCTDYADIQLAIKGICEDRDIKGLYVFRFYRGEMGNYKGKMIESMEKKI
ncbi:MAG TPA: hypothetical protein VFG29_13090 [Syntrophales bacterium]|nr:hypothetical protein [Syntrophales bacterium]